MLLAGVILLSSNVFAHESFLNSDYCNIDVNGGVRISASEIEFSKDNHQLYKIIDNKQLIVEEKVVALDAQQQQLISNYSKEIRELILQVKNLATGALMLASDGVNLAFNELLGEGNSLSEDITAHFHEISNEIELNFAEDETIYFDENGFSGNDFFSENFEKRIEKAVEATIEKSIGSVIIAIGQELLFSDDDVTSFESKMEHFGEKIEREMGSRGREIEKRAQKLCYVVAKIDVLELGLQQGIEEINDINMLSVQVSKSDAI